MAKRIDRVKINEGRCSVPSTDRDYEPKYSRSIDEELYQQSEVPQSEAEASPGVVMEINEIEGEVKSTSSVPSAQSASTTNTAIISIATEVCRETQDVHASMVRDNYYCSESGGDPQENSYPILPKSMLPAMELPKLVGQL